MHSQFSETSYGISTIWFSLARLTAVFGIFLYHYTDLSGIYLYPFDYYSISIFCFLSGFFLNAAKDARVKWAIKRYLGIMVPYWLVIIPVFIANHIFQYKNDLTFTSYFVTVFFGNMFLSDPLYVIAWYITFVLLLYAYAFVESFLGSNKKIIFMFAGILLFSMLPQNIGYFILFSTGLRLSERYHVAWPQNKSGLNAKITSVFFTAQRYCYSFFLIHGAVLLFFFRKTDMSPAGIFALSMASSVIMSFILCNISGKLIVIAANKAFKLNY